MNLRNKKCEICGKEAEIFLFGRFLCKNEKCIEEARKLSMARHKFRVVAVGSLNPVKIEAVKEGFEKVLGTVEVIGVDVESNVSSHPIGLEETYKGALNRAKNAFNKVQCSYGVGIEAGLINVGGHYVDIHVCVVYDGIKETVGMSQGFEYPKIVAENILKGIEGGKIAEKLTGIKDIGKNVGLIGYLTDNHITRKDLCRESVIMALIPRMMKNRNLF
ncbi:putative inosine/xanthosine triphosphatase [Methanocaldococcus lauensis]|uniref:Probable inosine/xanthosine triphosphatase n=1 Tax=Methanocaldococcus lauensis TaxID=2546128 RepID=A0A8D6PRF9_9EURY|nr:inosine/xanthosine triphosphatase [Methanocaldococcus lauensis]CAB3287052.1 putative inosine/xanthosine triphosphatase [Methanocaldococcus lauensis]